MISLNRNQLLFCNLCVLVLLFIYIHSRLNTTLYADYPKIPSLIHVDPQLEQIVIYNRVRLYIIGCFVDYNLFNNYYLGSKDGLDHVY